MNSIFFDLETSGQLFLGQILNYHFLLVDREFKPINSLSGDIRISRLELPSPRAILANRIDVLKHQASAAMNELEAVRQITAFINESIASSRGEVNLIGYNSARFDVPFLRTTLMRNGFNPYFGGKLQYRDVLHGVRALYVRNPQFKSLIEESILQINETSKDNTQPKLSLTLESVSRALGLLDGKQRHHSEADVELLVNVVSELLRRFDFDMRCHQAYEVPEDVERQGRGTLIWSLEPNYDQDQTTAVARRPLMLLDSDYRAALWADLDEFKAGKSQKSIRYFNRRSGALVFGGMMNEPEAKLAHAAETALIEFSRVALSNYFTRSTCDIELDIYRIDIAALDILSGALRSLNAARLRTKSDGNPALRDAYVLFTRFKLRIAPDQTFEADPDFRRLLKQYALYRYGGAAQLDKDTAEREPSDARFHPTLRQMLAELDGLMKDSAQPNERELLANLRRFYLDSQIVEVAGDKLLEGLSEQDQQQKAVQGELASVGLDSSPDGVSLEGASSDSGLKVAPLMARN